MQIIITLLILSGFAFYWFGSFLDYISTPNNSPIVNSAGGTISRLIAYLLWALPFMRLVWVVAGRLVS